MAKKTKVTLPDVIKESAKYFSVKAEDLLDQSNRQKPVQNARLSAIFIAGRLDYSNKEIARALNYRSDTTVSSAFNKAMGKFDRDRHFAKNSRAIAKNLHTSVLVY